MPGPKLAEGPAPEKLRPAKRPGGKLASPSRHCDVIERWWSRIRLQMAHAIGFEQRLTCCCNALLTSAGFCDWRAVCHDCVVGHGAVFWIAAVERRIRSRRRRVRCRASNSRHGLHVFLSGGGFLGSTSRRFGHLALWSMRLVTIPFV